MSKRQHPNNPEYADAAVNALFVLILILILILIVIVFFKFVILIIE